MKNSKVLNMTKGLPKFSDLSRDEQIDYFISRISGHEKEVEIQYMLALHTAFNMGSDIYLKYFEGLDAIETTEDIYRCLDGGWQEEDLAWEAIISTLGADKIFDIIENINDYMDRYNKIKAPLDDLKFQLFSMFTKLEHKERQNSKEYEEYLNSKLDPRD